jgi:hypothetical protein
MDNPHALTRRQLLRVGGVRRDDDEADGQRDGGKS